MMYINMNTFRLCFFFTLMLSGVLCQRNRVVMQTQYGEVEGYERTVFGKKVSVYQGIPYAKPPVGELRFKKPQRVESWEWILLATEPGNSCVQETSDDPDEFEGEKKWLPNTKVDEDCLTLNIWSPEDLPEKASVMIWIYGGSFNSGTSSLELYDGAALAADRNVVVVSLNYRLGALGFLYVGTDDAPGNVGLWDQRLAIEWVKENIQFFGGDPDSITLFGESAGAASVSSHLLSPESRDLFQRAILQSGTMNAPWAWTSAEEARSHALTLIENCGCGNYSNMETENEIIDMEEAMECMREIKASEIHEQQKKQYSGLNLTFVPTIEGVFLPADPDTMLSSGSFGDQELLIGSNLDEGSYFLLYDPNDLFNKDTPTTLSREELHQEIDRHFYKHSKLERTIIKHQYTDWLNKNDSHRNHKLLSDAVGDKMFVCPTLSFAEMFVQKGNPVYYYYFTHRTESSPWGEWLGVLHGDEIEYVFGRAANDSLPYTESEKLLSLRMMQYFTDFAKTGRPVSGSASSSWPKYSPDNPKYFMLDAETGGIGKGPKSKACSMWNWLFPKMRELELGHPHNHLYTYTRFAILPNDHTEAQKKTNETNSSIVLIY